MCEFCSKHGDGEIWYKNAKNFADDLVSDLNRRTYIKDFLDTTIAGGFSSLGRLEKLYSKKGKLPARIVDKMIEKAKEEHFGQVLPFEEIKGIIEQSATVVRMPCACRWASEKKETRCCYGISVAAENWYDNLDLSYFGDMKIGGLEKVSSKEALEQVEQLEEKGAIHTIWTMVTPFIGAICNCTLQDCLALRTMALDVETLYKAEHVAVVDTATCTGCGLCQQECQFGAISSVTHDESQVAMINPVKCFGCGLCRNQCPSESISLHLR